MDAYLSTNRFLTSINNEIPETRNQSYGHNLASLHTLVLVIFTEDKTVVPKESAWFGSEAGDKSDGDQQRVFELNKIVIPMRLQPLYKEDWIGLRTLDEREGVVFEACVGEHMQIKDCWERVVRQYVGGPRKL
jgi:palmitoyl-protein thioesterase